MEIPVYGLSGVDDCGEFTQNKTFKKTLERCKSANLKNKLIRQHYTAMKNLNGIYQQTAAKVKNGTATNAEKTDFKKARILLQLEGVDYDAFRLANIYMPYVSDVDEKDGGYLFPTKKLATIAARSEEELLQLKKNNASEETLGNWLSSKWKQVTKSVSNAAKSTVKAITNTAKAAYNSAVNTTKAAFNVTKAGFQAATGNTGKAKESLKTAGNQFKSAAVDPLKQAASDTKMLWTDTVVNPTKTFVVDPLVETVRIAGKLFKVLFILLNPLTVIIRSSIRAACSLNLFGIATKMAVGLMLKNDALKLGYTEAQWQKANKAVNDFKKLFKKMGGTPSKLEKSIRNGANKKPLFKKDIRPDSKIHFANGDDGETTLADPATIAAIIAAAGSVLAVALAWVKDVVIMNKQVKETKRQEQRADEKEAQFKEEQKQQAAAMYAADAAATAQKEEKKKKNLLIAAAAAAGLFLILKMK